MKDIKSKAAAYLRKHAVKGRLRSGISVLSCIIVFTSTYALLLPALTLESRAACGMEEHQHTEECYGNVLVCGQEESEGHTHTEECYNDAGELICGQEESEGHTHTEDCYEKQLTCGKEVHIHTEACYSDEEEEQADSDSTKEQSDDAKVSDSGQNDSDNDGQDAASAENKEQSQTDQAPSGQGAAEQTASEQTPSTQEDGKQEDMPAGAADPESLDRIKFVDYLTDETTVLYVPEDGDKWQPIHEDDEEDPEEDVKLTPDQKILLHIGYELPAGTINETNAETEYTLPLLMNLSDDEVEENNEKYYNMIEGTDREADDLKSAGRYEIREKKNDDGEVIERKLVLTFDSDACKKNGGEKLTDGTETLAAQKLEGFFEILISAQDLVDPEAETALEKERVDLAPIQLEDGQTKENYLYSYLIEWNEDKEELDTEVFYDGPALDAWLADQTGEKEEDSVFAAGTLEFEGEDYKVAATFDESAQLPEGVTLQVSELKGEEYDAYLEQAQSALGEEKTVAGARFFDITFVNADGEPVEPKGMVDVRIEYERAETIEDSANVEGLHFTEEGAQAIEMENNGQTPGENGEPALDSVSFSSDSFSVYGVVYTVDFYWEVDGEVFEFSIPGGGFVSFTDLIQVLGVVDDPDDTATEENTADNGAEVSENETEISETESEISETEAETDVVEGEEGNDPEALSEAGYRVFPFALQNVNVSDATREFVADVENVEFSSPELVDVSRVEDDTTVGQLKESRELDVQYSAELTGEDIDRINSIEVEAGDWALISMQPFMSEETLTITMKTGEVFLIKVTDNQAKDPLGLDQESFVITNGDHNRSLKAQADSNTGSLQAQNPPSSDAINIWKFEYDETAFDGTGGYYLVCVINNNNNYLRVNGNSLELAPVKPSEAQEGQPAATPFKVDFDHTQMKYRISGAADGNSAYITFEPPGWWESGNGRFSLSNTKSDNNLLQLRDTNQPSSTPGTVGTWDIKSDGIVMKLFDYEGRVNNQDIDDVWGYQVSNTQLRDGQGINHDRSLLFSGSGLSNSDAFNNFTGDKTGGTYYSGYAYQDIVKYNLGTDGFPVLQSDKIKTGTDRTSGGSLAYLFNDSDISNTKTSYTGEGNSGLNGLLRKDGEGYYYFDSEENFAKLVGDEVILYSDTYNKNNSSSTDVKTTKIGLFPFDNYQSNQGEEKGPSGSVYHHQFGMSIATDFIYPEDGIVPETDKPMVFEFSGDDDVWVFVDGVLVLDLGGVHQPISGKIDFYTGNVTITEFGSNGVEYTSSKSTTIDAMFAKASQEAGKTITFDRSEYSEHKLEFFYLERGGCDSNCKIKFNLLTTKTVTVEKKLDGLSAEELEKYSDQEFAVELCRKNSSTHEEFELYNTADTEEYDTERNHTVRRDANGNVVETGFPIKNGQISLKPGETVTVSMLPTTAQFHVAEIDQANMAAYGTPSGERYYNGEKLESITLEPSHSHYTETVNDWQSDDYAVSDTDKIVIINEPLHTSLTVNKLWGDGNENHTSGSIQFTVQATIPGEGEGAEPVPYAVSDIDGKVFEVTAEGGWTRTIESLPETTPDGKPITYTVTEVPVEGYTSTVTAEGTTHTIVNTPGHLKIIKTVTYNNETPDSDQLEELKGTYKFGVFLDESCQTPYTQNGTAVTLTVEINGNATAESQIIKLPLGTYWLKEETPENGAIPVQNGIRVDITAQNTTVNPAVSNFTNNYNHGGPDEVILDVQKTFTGLTDKSHIPEGFYVRISYKVNGVEDHVDLRNKSEGNVQWIESNGGMTWSWKVSGIPTTATDFKIQEFNSAATGYSPVVTILNGDEVDLTSEAQAAEVQMPTVTLDEVGYDIYSPDNEKVFPVDDNTIFLTRLTGSQGQSAGHTFVISNKTLSFRERAAVEKVIKGFNNNWVLPAEFYSIENNGTTFYYKGKTINVINAPFYDKHGRVIDTPFQQAVKFSDTNQWTHTASYSITIDYHETENAFEIVNSYEEIPVTVNVIKVKEGTTQRLSGAVFSLRKLDEPAEPTESGTFSGSEVTGSPFTSNENGEIAVQGLTHGYYELKEINAPPGYVLTNALPEYFKIEAGTVSWIEWKETEAGSGWVVKAAGDHVTFENATFTVENEPGVALPNTGGPGTGMLYLMGIMMAAFAGAGLVKGRRRRGR